MGKKIIYLDQNYLSNMAKARAGLLRHGEANRFYTDLFDLLRQLVLAGRIICPESEFHSVEAEFDKRISEDILRTIDELSGGLHFLHMDQLIFNQVESALGEYLRTPKKDQEWWMPAFYSNPDVPLKAFRVSVRIPFSNQLIEHDRKLKAYYPEGALRFVESASSRTFDEELLAQKRSFIGSYFIEPLLPLPLPSNPIDHTIRLINLGQALSRLQIFEAMGLSKERLADFLDSDELRSIPFIHIFCSMNAVIVQHYSSRRIRQSDLHDLPILASTLPFCDVVTTDAFMKSIVVDRLSFHKEYDAQVYSARKRDRGLFFRFLESIWEAAESVPQH